MASSPLPRAGSSPRAYPPKIAFQAPPSRRARLKGQGAPAMCRNLRVLHTFEPAATEDEVRGAALAYVRKVSGSTEPSQGNAFAFRGTVAEGRAATRRLLD